MNFVFEHRSCGDEGVIICESLDPYITDDLAHIAYQQNNKKNKRMGGQVRIRVRYKNFIGKWFDYLLVSKKEMKEITQGTGWYVERTFDATEIPVFVAVLRKGTMP